MTDAVRDDMKLVANLAGTLGERWDEMTPGVRLAYLAIMRDTIEKLQWAQEAAE